MRKIQSIRKQLEKYLEEIDIVAKQAEKNLQKAPKGSLILSKSNGSVQHYHKTEVGQKKGVYILAKNRKLAENLAQKDYSESLLKILEKHKSKMCRAIHMLPKEELEDVYLELPEARRNLVKPYILTDEQYVERWSNVQYTGKIFDPGAAAIFTERGEQVRSKSEKILADKFLTLGIPYRYEFPLKIKGYGMVYPDFTLLNVEQRKEFYFEHFGMMDNPDYCQNALAKLESYAQNGIYPGKNLLLTFETLQKPLDMRVVEKMLKEFILQ